MRLNAEEMLDKISGFVLLGATGFHAFEAFSATALDAEFARKRALNIAAMRERDDHRVIGDEVLHGDLANFGDDVALPWSGEAVFDDAQLVLDDGEHSFLTGENVHEVQNIGKHGVVFCFYLVALHTCELVEAEFEDGIHLTLAEEIGVSGNRRLRTDQDAKRFGSGGGETVSGKTLAGFIAVFRGADDLDKIIEVTKGEKEGFEQLRAFFRFA